MEGLDKGGQGPISGCCAIEEEEEGYITLRFGAYFNIGHYNSIIGLEGQI
jgi:hypothetical protein